MQSPPVACPTFTVFTPIQRSPEGSLCVYEGRSDCGESTVMVLFQLFLGDCECVQTGICNAIMILRKSCRNKTNLNHWKCLFKGYSELEELGGAFFCSSLLYRCLLHCVCITFFSCQFTVSSFLMCKSFQRLYQANKCYRHFRASTLYTHIYLMFKIVFRFCILALNQVYR